MNENEKYRMLNPLRYSSAVLIAVGGSMHLTAFIKGVMDKSEFPFWYYVIFFIAIPGYFISSALIIKNIKHGYFFAFISPIIGGLLIFFGFIFPESKLLILIPGTYTNEITFIGFVTLISEPIASSSCAFLIKNEIWKLQR